MAFTLNIAQYGHRHKRKSVFEIVSDKIQPTNKAKNITQKSS